MYGLNRATLAGNVGDHPKAFEKDGKILNATFPLATNEYFKTKEGEEKKETQWHHIKVWNKQAEVILQYLKRGDPIFVEGKILTEKYKDPEGNEKFFTEIRCDNFIFLSGPKEKE